MRYYTLRHPNYLCQAFFGKESRATEFIQKKIDESPNGENEEVWADESQMVCLLMSMHVNTDEPASSEGIAHTDEDFE